MNKSPAVYRLSDGQEFEVSEPISTQVENSPPGRIAAASDMDHTMVANDLGVLVFLEKIQDREFWNMNLQEFKSLLLPRVYMLKISEWAKSGHKELKSAHCKLLFGLYGDIINLFNLQQIHKQQPDSRTFSMIMTEFARKMLEIDRVILELDQLLRREMGDKLLMRTRFFAGRKPRRIRELTKRVIEKSKQYDNASRFVSFPIYEELRKTGKQKVNAEKIREVFGKESPFEHYDRKLNVVDTTRLALHDLVQLNIPTAVATTNLEGIAQTLVEQTEYEFLAEQEFNKYYGSKNVVLGTRLKQKGKLLGPEIDGLPLAGNAKAQAVLRFASKMNREPKVFLGDSPSGDLETVIATLQREGSVYLVGSDADDVARKFRKKLLDVFGAHGGEMDNVFCIESGQEGFAH